MAQYPTSIPNFGPDEQDNVDVVYDDHVNELRAEIIAVAAELGTLAKGAASSVKQRIADLEANRSLTSHTHSDYLTKSLLTAKGDLYAASASGVVIRQAVGGTGQVLSADSTKNTGLAWKTLSHGDLTNLTTGDPHTQYLNPARHAAENHAGLPGIPPFPFVGMVVPAALANAPSGYLKCEGQAVSRTTYSALFAAIGTAYGAGDGGTTFNVPDLRDRVVVGTSASKTLGLTGGADSVALATNHLAPHDHGSSGVHNHTATVGNQSASHTHTGTTDSHSHNHGGTNSSGSAHEHDLRVRETIGTHNHSTTSGGYVAAAGGTTGSIDNYDAMSSDGSHTHTIPSDSHTHSMTTGNQSASHNHTVTVNNSTGHTHTSVGNGDPVSVLQPFQVLTYLIYAGV